MNKFTNVTHKEVLDMLISARGFVESGWVKGTMHSGHSHCSLGGIEAAMRKALHKNTFADQNFFTMPHFKASLSNRQEAVAFEAALRLNAAISGQKKFHYGNIVSFNDDPKTTKADVLKAFDVAISRTRNRRPYINAKRLVPGKAA